ncbi:Os04g0273100, partial [Oryza sativa Japonica Group]
YDACSVLIGSVYKFVTISFLSISIRLLHFVYLFKAINLRIKASKIKAISSSPASSVSHLFLSLCPSRVADHSPPIRHNPFGELKRLTQTSTVVAYQECFLALTSRIPDPLTESQQVQLFIAGLQDDISIDVELQKPDDLQDAMRLPRAYEWKANKPGAPPRRVFARAAAAITPDPPPAGGSTAADSIPRQFRRLSPAELAELRKWCSRWGG